LVDIPVRIDDLVERVGRVDHRTQVTLLDQRAETEVV
jgi:hypothetical protein